MRAFSVVESRIAILPRNDIDTDQIIPARFLKVTDRSGLGSGLFSDWRGPDFVLDRPEAAGVEILVTGNNFGCGSSREHAPWALVEWGLRAIISTAFADIFRNNALKNGLVPVVVSAKAHAKLLASPWSNVKVDLTTQTVTLPDGTVETFPVPPFSRKCLLAGNDELEYLLAHGDAVAAFEARA